MEPKNKKVLLVSDLIQRLSVFNFWSQKSFQNLIESGILSDIAELIKLSDTNKPPLNLICITGSSGYPRRGDVTFKQMSKAFEFISTDDLNKWNTFLDFLLYLGYSSNWWEQNKPNWEWRDEFRKEIGLEPLNPIWENAQGLKIVFKATGHCEVWKNPPEGYRYVSTEEVDTDNRSFELFMDFQKNVLKKVILLKSQNTWYMGVVNPDEKTKYVFLDKGSHSEVIVSEVSYAFHHFTFFVPLVKL